MASRGRPDQATGDPLGGLAARLAYRVLADAGQAAPRGLAPLAGPSVAAGLAVAAGLRDRLAKLVESGVLVKVPYSDHPPRYDYLLTDSGRDLWPVLTAMRQWGDHHGRPDGPIRMAHAACGAPAETVVVCGSCGDRLGPGETTMVPKASLTQS